MYVCGPTLYSDVHIGNCRTFTSFDIMYRYLLHIGYKVRYVRNITDVGHLEDEVAGVGEDRIGKQARLKKLEPMEIVLAAGHVVRVAPSFDAVALRRLLDVLEQPSAC